MNIVAVDDESLLLMQLSSVLQEVFPGASIHSYEQGSEVLAYIQDNPEEPLDYVFLDIKLGDMLGIDLARQIRDVCPQARVVFTTGYSDFALDAFDVRAVGYLLKPITKEKVCSVISEIDLMLGQDSQSGANSNALQVQTFGRFEVFHQGVPVSWKRQKAKEVFAFLVDAHGTALTNGDIWSTIWDDKPLSLGYLHTVISSLRATLDQLGFEDILVRSRGCTSIDISKIDCDYLHFLEGDKKAIDSYFGEYMSQYSWAEVTNARLNQMKRNKPENS